MRSETVPPPSATCPGEGSPRGGSLSSAHTAWKEAGVPPRPDRRHDPELILRVNREYHDVEGSAYDERHDEIFIEEVARWQGVGRELLEGKPERLEVLDVGTGTGFVPLQVARFLKPGDRFVCSDISARILECCERAVGRAGPRCALEFVQVDGRRYPFEGGRFDLVTLNSVVHHLPEFAPFFREIDRILRPGGRIAIAHEPNRRFYGHPLLWRSSRILTALLQPWQGAVAAMRTLRIDRALKALRLHALLRRATHRARGRRVREEVRSHEEVLERVNARLLEGGAIETPLSGEEITTLVDFHSPTAGTRLDPERGIEVSELLGDTLRVYEVERLETYRHLGDVSARCRLTRRCDEFLARRFPMAGSTLFLLLRKPCDDAAWAPDQAAPRP